MTNITNTEKYKSFKKECKFFFCNSLYDGEWDGKERFIVASDTAEEELLEKYPEFMKMLSPYLLCNAACGEVFAESMRNINKYEKRKRNTISTSLIDDFSEQIVQSSVDLDTLIALNEAFSVCTPIQIDRIKKYYFENMSLNEIANGVNPSSVLNSIQRGLENMRVFLLGGYEREKTCSWLREKAFQALDKNTSLNTAKGEQK